MRHFRRYSVQKYIIHMHIHPSAGLLSQNFYIKNCNTKVKILQSSISKMIRVKGTIIFKIVL